MGKVILTSCGNQNVEVIRIVREITGLSLADAMDTVDAVEKGTYFTMDVADGQENTVIDQFSVIGAKAISCASQTENKIILNEKQNENREVYIEKSVVGTTSFIPNITNPQNREETLSMLYEVGKIAEDHEYLNEEIISVKKNINSEKEKAEELRHIVSGTANAIKWGAILCSLLTWSIIPVVFTVIVWIVMNKTVIKNDLKKHEVENNVKAERYIVQHVNPLVLHMQKIERDLEELNSSGKLEWAKDIVGENMFYSVYIGDLYDLVKGRRADDLKEALNLYEDIQYKARMEARQAAIQNASEIAAAEAVKQTAYYKEIAKNSNQTAKAANVTAYYTREVAKNTRRFR